MSPDEAVEQAALLDVPANIAGLYVAALDEARRWREAAAAIEQHLVLVLDSYNERQILIDGLGLFQRERKQSRKAWQHDDLWRDVVKRGLAERRFDPSTGEVQTELDSVLAALRKALSPSWKTGGLKDLGLDPDEYSEGAWTDAVRVTRP